MVHKEGRLGAEDFAIVGVREVIIERELDNGQHFLAGLLILVPINDHHVLLLLREFLVEVLSSEFDLLFFSLCQLAVFDEEVKDFQLFFLQINAIDTNGFGYFYGANAKEQRHITPYGIINRILKRSEKIKSLIPPEWDGDKEYWLPDPLCDLA